MKIGVAIPTQVPNLSAKDVLGMADRVERHGLDSIWVLDRLIYDSFAPLPTLAAVAAVTERARLGTCVLLAPLYNPFHLAKETATIDRLSDGRLTLGVGLGNRAEDFRATAVPVASRVRRLEETLPLLRQAWAGEPIHHEGRVFAVDLPAMGPRPVQQPSIPIWIGAYADPAIERAARLGDGFLAGGRGPSLAREVIPKFREGATRHGRDAASLPTAGLIYASLGKDVETDAASVGQYLERYYGRSILDPSVDALVGPPPEAAARLRDYDGLDMDELIVIPVSRDPEQVDRLAEVVAASR